MPKSENISTNPDISANFEAIFEKVSGSVTTQTRTSTSEAGRTTTLISLGSTSLKTPKNISENSMQEKNMDEGPTSTRTGMSIKASGLTILKTDLGFYTLRRSEIGMKGFGRRAIDRVRGPTIML